MEEAVEAVEAAVEAAVATGVVEAAVATGVVEEAVATGAVEEVAVTGAAEEAVATEAAVVAEGTTSSPPTGGPPGIRASSATSRSGCRLALTGSPSAPPPARR